MKKNIFLLVVFFLVAIGMKAYSQTEYTFSYYVQVKATSAIPSHIDEKDLTQEDKEELADEEDESDFCVEDDTDYDYWEMASIFDMDKSEIIDLFQSEGFQTTEQNDIITGIFNEDEDSVNIIIDLNELTYEHYYFYPGDDNLFFNEEGNNLWGIRLINFVKTNGGYIIPVKDTEMSYDTLSSGIPYEVTEVWTFLYYEVKEDNNTIIKTGDETLFNNCIESTFITETQAQNVEMNIYPNPAKEQITVSLSSFTNENVNIEVFNTVGSVVFQGQAQGEQTELDIQFLPAGFYIIRCANEGKVVSKRFVKQ